MPAWIGYLPIGKPIFFYSQKKPTQKSHGKKFSMVSGPFQNKQKAKEAYEAGWR